jgi:hypothetical protein
VDPRAGLDDLEKRKFFTLPELELRPLSRPVRSQSLYRLRFVVGANKSEITAVQTFLVYIGLTVDLAELSLVCVASDLLRFPRG